MDPQIALQFLGTLIQTSGTILAIYIAILIYTLQDKTLSSLLLKDKSFLGTIGLSCGLWVLIIALSLADLFSLNLKEPYSDFMAFNKASVFVFALLFMVADFIRLIWKRKKLLQEEMVRC